MLAYLSADCPREEWLTIGAALKSGLGDDGRPVFDDWSQGAPDCYDAHQCRRAWDSLSADGDVTWGTLVYRSRLAGWKPSPDTALTVQWTIRETDGTPVAIHYRTTLPNGGKRIWWGLPGGSKGLGGRKARTLPLYGAELLADSAATAICIVEGEKAADALRKAEPSVLVLGTVTGAASSPSPEVLQPVAASGRPVLLWPDADPDGSSVRHMHRVAARLIEAGGEAPSLIEWPGAPPKGDAADWAVARKPSFDELAAAATVIKPKRKRQTRSLAKAPSHTDGLPVIVAVPGERARWTREAVVALVAVGPQNDRESLYASARAVYETGDNAGDLLFLREAPPPKPDSSMQTPEGTLLYAPATLVAVQSLIDTAVRWYVVRKTRGGEIEEVPGEIRKGDVDLVIERYRHDCLDHKRPRLRVLRGIVDAPTLRADGSLLAKQGYDDSSGLYANLNPDAWPKIPSSPTRDDARAALAKLYDLVTETPFATNVHRAVWLAGLLTVVARDYAAGNVPLFAFSANVAGAGKGTLVDLTTEIATGRGATKWAPVSASHKGDTEAEERKRLMAVALSGIRVLCIDNISPGKPLGTPALEAALTAGEDEQIGTISDRVLGETRQTEAPWRCVVMAAGNNLTVMGDMGRRALLCRLESSLQDPELRQFKHYPQLLQHTRKHRSELLTAALTILIAHKHAVDSDEPDTLLPRVNSFGAWSDRVRSAVWWVDPERCDPWDGNRELKKMAQPEQEEALAFFAAWHETFGSREVQVRDLESSCRPEDRDYRSDLADAVAELGIAAARGNAALNVRSMGMWLAAHADRPGSYILRKVEGTRKWFVERGAPADSEAAAFQALPNVTIDDLARALGASLEAGKRPQVRYEYGEDSVTVVLSEPPMRADGVPIDVWRLFHCLMSGWPAEDVEVYWELWHTRRKIVAALREVADTDENSGKVDELAQLPLEYFYFAVAGARRFRTILPKCVVEDCFEDPLSSAGYCIVHMPDDHRIGDTTVGDLREAGWWWPYEIGPIALMVAEHSLRGEQPEPSAGNLEKHGQALACTQCGAETRQSPSGLCVRCELADLPADRSLGSMEGGEK